MKQGQEGAYLSDLLADLQTFLECELGDMGFGLDAGRVASKCAELIRVYWGGQQIYIPRGRFLEITVRDLKVEASFTGNKDDTRKICRRFNLTQRHVYRIVNNVRAARRKRLEAERGSDANGH